MRRALPFVTVLVVLAAVRTGWIFYQRYNAGKAEAERAEEKKLEDARKVTEMLGNGRVKILNLSLDPPVIRIGGESELCYGVSNAKSVTIEPIGTVDPAYARCMKVRPRQDTAYVITAKDAAGNTETATLKLRVY